MGNWRTPKFGIIIGLLATAFALSLIVAYQPAPAASVSIDLSRIPRTAAGWKMVAEQPLDDPRTKDLLRADSYVNRRYLNQQGDEVDLLIVYRQYMRRQFTHRPELCFPASGYTLLKNNNITLPYARREVSAKYLTAMWKDTTLEQRPDVAITYFFASGNKTEEDYMKQQLWMSLERVLPNKNGWTFIRMTSNLRHTPGEDPVQIQKSFMATFSPSIEQIITTSPDHA